VSRGCEFALLTGSGGSRIAAAGAARTETRRGTQGSVVAVMHIDLGNLVFLIAMVVALVLLLITVVLDDIVGGVLDSLHIGIDVGGVAIAPIALGFVSMFGIGGLFGTTVIGMESGLASVLGAGTGAVGAFIVYGMFRILTRSEGPQAYSISDLVGVTGRVVVGIPKGRHGEVVVSFAGVSQKRTATSDEAIKSGATVKIVDIAGSVLVVEPAASAVKPNEPS
jgi:membrane-bound ClpP family serine protease